MKYLDILKEYDRAIVSESRKLDEIYAKLVGESCTCGKCEECKAREEADGEEVKEGCDRDKRMTEFSEGEKEDGKSDKKMLTKDDFFGKGDEGGSENVGDDGVEDKPVEKPADGEESGEVQADEDKADKPKKVKKADEAIDDATKKEIRTFFGCDKGDDGDNDKKLALRSKDVFAEGDDEEKPTDEPEDEPKKDECKPDDDEELGDGFEQNKRMSAAGLFSEGDDGKKCEDSECDGDDCKEQDNVAEGDDHLTMKEIMAKESEGEKKPEDDTDGDEEIPASEPEDNADADDEADKDEKKSEEDEDDEGPVDEEAEEERCLNESIQAITKFVKANRKFFG